MGEYVVANCPECGNVYQKNFRQMCHDCTEKLDKEFKLVIDFLKHNRNVTVSELSANTGVEESRIKKWIRDQRILLHDYPNMTYDCELCSHPIRNGKLCLHCSARLKTDIARMNQEEERPSGIGFHSRLRGRD